MRITRWTVLAIALCGCGAPPSPSNQQLFSITAVQRENEKETIETKLVSAQEWAATFNPAPSVLVSDGLGESEQAIHDNPCKSSSIHLYDNTSLGCAHLGCNVICFSGPDVEYLSLYCRTYDVYGNCTDHWDGNTKSFNARGSSGRLFLNNYCWENVTGTTQTNTDVCGTGAVSLEIF